jgi:PKD repeat protein
MKLSIGKLIVLLLIIAVPMFVWGTMSQNLETRQFATDDGITPTATPSATPTNSPNAVPTCSGLSTIPSSGTKPLTVSFACAGNDTNNDITAAEFDFGEGSKVVVEKGIGQFGSLTATHTYTSVGTYNATCRVRDNNQAYSTIPENCKRVITVSAVTPAPTKAASGSSDMVIYTGSTASPTAYIAPPTPTQEPIIPTPIITPKPTQDYSKFWQLGQVALISVITIAVGLLLRHLVGGSD